MPRGPGARAAERDPARRQARPARSQLPRDRGARHALRGGEHRRRDPQPAHHHAALRARAALARRGPIQGAALLRWSGDAPGGGRALRVERHAEGRRVSRAAARLSHHASGEHRAAAGAARGTHAALFRLFRLGAAPARERDGFRQLVRAAGERGAAVSQGHRQHVGRAGRTRARGAHRATRAIRYTHPMISVLRSLLPLAALMLAAPAFAQEDAMLLIAHPAFRDVEYRQTVLLAAPAPNGGHVGVILNRPTRRSLGTLSPEHEPSKKVVDPVYYGGPFSRGALVALRGDHSPGAGSVLLMKDLYLAFRANTIDHVIETTPNEARYFVGYVG